MTVDLSAGVSHNRGNVDGGFFSTDVQEALFKRGIYGTDLQEAHAAQQNAEYRMQMAAQQQQPTQQEIDQFQRMERITNMVDRGELVPANNFQPIQNVQGYAQNENRTATNSNSPDDT